MKFKTGMLVPFILDDSDVAGLEYDCNLVDIQARNRLVANIFYIEANEYAHVSAIINGLYCELVVYVSQLPLHMESYSRNKYECRL